MSGLQNRIKACEPARLHWVGDNISCGNDMKVCVEARTDDGATVFYELPELLAVLAYFDDRSRARIESGLAWCSEHPSSHLMMHPEDGRLVRLGRRDQ